tara:strand:- start:51 stop:365 length:315 start_codon:yes stop_codon:yes gene_type:complete
MTLVFILLCCAGLTFILKYGSILAFIRKPLIRIKFFEELFKCSLCLGFWSGVILAVIVYHLDLWENLYYLLPLASACFTWFMDSFIGVFQWSELYLEKQNKNNQ